MKKSFPGRRDFIKYSGLSTLGFLSQEYNVQSEAAKNKLPNIVFIFSDDHPDRAMSCYGSVVNKTPHLDRIANEGMRFEHTYVTMSLCAPSRASVLTGTYPHINGQVTISRVFDGSQPTFPKLLHENGYQTALIGKWHLWSEPVGFDHWNVLIGQGPYFDPPMVENGVYREYKGYTTDIITDLSLEWLKQHDPSKPFCLLCHHKAPHYVCEPDEKHEHMYDNTVFPIPETFNDTAERHHPIRNTWDLSDIHIRKFKNNPRWQNLPEGLTPQERKEDNYQRFMRDMLATIASMDENIGRLLDYLDENNLTENTIVIYAADNGYFMGEHGWIDKKDPYEESIRIPFLVRYPERIKPGTVNGDFVLNIDFAPTLLDYAGVKIPPEMQGRSIRPLLEGKLPDDWRTSIYIQFHVIDKFPYYGIRTEQYKLVYFYDQVDDWEFYDLGKDPHELNNAYHDPEYGDVITHLKRELEDLRRNYDIDSVKEQNILNQTEIWERERENYLDKKMKEWKKT